VGWGGWVGAGGVGGVAWGGVGSSIVGNGVYPEIFLIGDSHAGSLRYGLDMELRRKNIAGYVVSRTATTMFNTNLVESQAALQKLDEWPQVSTVILVQHWLLYLSGEQQASEDIERRYTQLEEFAFHIKSKGKRLLIVEGVPDHKYSLNEILARMAIVSPRRLEPEWKSLLQTEEEYNLMQKNINLRLDEICRKTGAVSIPLNLAFKENGNYIYFDTVGERLIPLYREHSHLSKAGSLRAAQFMMPWLLPAPSSGN
jgi:hypothetical protein